MKNKLNFLKQYDTSTKTLRELGVNKGNIKKYKTYKINSIRASYLNHIIR